jgi:hypothetical protein
MSSVLEEMMGELSSLVENEDVLRESNVGDKYLEDQACRREHQHHLTEVHYELREHWLREKTMNKLLELQELLSHFRFPKRICKNKEDYTNFCKAVMEEISRLCAGRFNPDLRTLLVDVKRQIKRIGQVQEVGNLDQLFFSTRTHPNANSLQVVFYLTQQMIQTGSSN